MASDELDLDVENKDGGKKKLILIIVGALVLVAIAVGATLFLMGGSSDGGASKEQSKKDEKPFNELPAHYMGLSPEFIVNFEDSSQVSYMQLGVDVMAREQATLDMITEHMPVIRNNILILLSSQKYEEINTRAGKEKLRGEVLAVIQKVLDEEGAAKPAEGEDAAKASKHKVEAVYFTSLVMQ